MACFPVKQQINGILCLKHEKKKAGEKLVVSRLVENFPSCEEHTELMMCLNAS